MSLITASEAAKILEISKRTLFRWEKEGKVKSIREGILKVRLFDRNYIEESKRILDLDQKAEGLVAKLGEAVAEQKKVLFAQDVKKVRAGEPLYLMDMEKIDKAMDKVDKAEKEWRIVVDELLKFPRQRLKELTLKK